MQKYNFVDKMTSKLYLFLPFLVLFISCKKSSQPAPTPSIISISGEIYPTVTIGSQEWTAVNYNGPGGKEGNFRANNSNYKKYFILTDLADVQLPAGWRIPTAADYNKLLSNFTKNTDLEGNFVASLEQSLTLKSSSDWDIIYSDDKQGTNSSGFNAYPAGYYSDYPQNNDTQKNYALFLTSTPLPDAKKNFHASYYSFTLTQLYLTLSSDDRTLCFGCLIDNAHNTDLPKSVRFVRDK